MRLSEQPKIAVFLAAYNGMCYLPEQLDSILIQAGVVITVYLSVDASLDGTEAWLDGRALEDDRVAVLSHGRHFGSAARNFFRILHEVDFSEFDYVAFADQDDIWELDKLIRHADLIKQHHADGVSSNVAAFWPNGKEKLLVKSQPQKKLDYLFESAGPGCTFLMTPWLVNKVQEQLLDANSPARDVALHDWLTYAICRAHGKRWVIAEQPSVRYRQHGNNVVGANVGVKAAWARLLKIRLRWYRNEVQKIAQVSQRISESNNIGELVQLLKYNNFFTRFKLLKFVPQARRSGVDRMALALAIVVGLF